MPHDLVNAKPVMAEISEFFGSSKLLKFIDQTNPPSEITLKRRVTALLPGGLTAIAFGGQKKRKLGDGIGFPIPEAALYDPVANITRAMYTAAIGSMFSFSQRGLKLADFALIAVYNLNPPFVKGNGTSTRECFSVVFAGPHDLVLTQNTYQLQHKTLGKFDLFVVPGKTDISGRHYEANINRVYP
jgi:hypothetical protein